VIKFLKKWSYRFFEEDAAVRGDYDEAKFWLKKAEEL